MMNPRSPPSPILSSPPLTAAAAARFICASAMGPMPAPAPAPGSPALPPAGLAVTGGRTNGLAEGEGEEEEAEEGVERFGAVNPAASW